MKVALGTLSLLLAFAVAFFGFALSQGERDIQSSSLTVAGVLGGSRLRSLRVVGSGLVPTDEGERRDRWDRCDGAHPRRSEHGAARCRCRARLCRSADAHRWRASTGGDWHVQQCVWPGTPVQRLPGRRVAVAFCGRSRLDRICAGVEGPPPKGASQPCELGVTADDSPILARTCSGPRCYSSHARRSLSRFHTGTRFGGAGASVFSSAWRFGVVVRGDDADVPEPTAHGRDVVARTQEVLHHLSAPPTRPTGRQLHHQRLRVDLGFPRPGATGP